MRRGRPKTRVGNNYCAECKIEMKEVFYVRTMPKLCKDCKGEAWAANSEVKKLYKDAIANPTEPAEDEMFFEDDPRAEKENDYGKVIKQATVISYGVSPLADIMTKTSYYNPVRGSAKDGFRYSYRKGKVK
jgi:Zn-finger nucleic acid-binding protein